jgi:hypothetical protein
MGPKPKQKYFCPMDERTFEILVAYCNNDFLLRHKADAVSEPDSESEGSNEQDDATVSIEQERKLLEEMVEETEKFLYLKKHDEDYHSEMYAPSAMVDAVWHAFILHTKLYEDFCEDNFIHHRPCEDGQLVEQYKNTLKRYKQVFKQDPPSYIWPNPDSPLGAQHLQLFKFKTSDAFQVCAKERMRAQ